MSTILQHREPAPVTLSLSTDGYSYVHLMPYKLIAALPMVARDLGTQACTSCATGPGEPHSSPRLD